MKINKDMVKLFGILVTFNMREFSEKNIKIDMALSFNRGIYSVCVGKCEDSSQP